MFALDHVNYARLLSVHVRDMATLHKSHPNVYQKFTSRAFAVQKSKNAFSAIVKGEVAPLDLPKIRVRYDAG